ncbi:MAG: hypothetical protein MRZ79_07860 [Bacteroidia bacterium]|nr:hypothetical protein [Bacteroidia bacterium]
MIRFANSWLTAYVCFAIMVFALTSCQNNSDLTADPSTQFRLMSKGKGSGSVLLEMSFDLESLTTIRPTSGKLRKVPDRIFQAPKIDRQTVNFTLYSSGEGRWVMENQTPTQNLTPNHESLPNNSPIPVKSVITGGKIYLYDSKGQLIQNHDVPAPDLSELVASINDLKSTHGAAQVNKAIAGMMTSSYTAGLDDLLRNPRNYGATINTISPQVSSIRVNLNAAGVPNTQDEVVLLIDTQRNLLLGSRLYDPNGQFRTSTMYRYDTGTQPYLKAIYQETPTQFPSGQAGMIKTQQTIRNLNIQV